jgi:ATPase subunit of ABC transporter with duplicated ATPase domains
MPDKIIFQLQDLHKLLGQREVLKGITLSFLEGAKIGVIGPNGAGKSTLLKILGGVDKQFEGVGKTSGPPIGYLAQEPLLNDELDVLGNLQAVAPLLAIEKRYNELPRRAMGEELTPLRAMAHWKSGSSTPSRARRRGARPPADGRGGEEALRWRRVALCKPCSSTRHVPSTSRRTTSTRMRSSGSSIT